MMNELGSFITTVGFPITVACAVGYVMYKVFMTLFSRIIETLDKLTETNRVLAEGVKTEIDSMNDKLDYVIKEIKKEVI